MNAKELADLIEAVPIDDDVIEIGLLTPHQRDLIVGALRGVAQCSPDRDAIARIINPVAFTALERSYIVPAVEEFMDMKIAREKADKILALLNAAPANRATAHGQPSIVGDDRESMGSGQTPAIVTGRPDPTPSVPSTHQRCAKCGCETKGEAALVDGKIWCHPCADMVPSTTRGSSE